MTAVTAPATMSRAARRHRGVLIERRPEWAPGVERYARTASHADLATWAHTDLLALPYEAATEAYATLLGEHGSDLDALAIVGLSDRYFLLTALLNRPDALHPWLYDRAREVQAAPDGHLDLWAREHYKSTIITLTGIIQEVLRDPEITIGIFSEKKGVSVPFLKQVKQEFERQSHIGAPPALVDLYPDVLWDTPESEAPTWTQEALIVRRKTNPKEATVEAHGLVGGMPTGRHFRLRVYDDVVTEKSVTSPEMVKSVDSAIQMSSNLGGGEDRAWYIGTRYHMGDPYMLMMERKTAKPRVFPATHDGTPDGIPVFFAPQKWEAKKRDQPDTLGAQMLQNPASGKEATFNPAWLTGWTLRPRVMTVYILVDPSRGRREGNDNTAIAVIGVGPDGAKYLLDGYRHRMDLLARFEAMLGLWRTWSTARGVQSVSIGWEDIGNTDLEYVDAEMRRRNLSGLTIHALAQVVGGAEAQRKVSRVKRLVPDIKQGVFRIPAVGWSTNLRCVAAWSVTGSEIGWNPDNPGDRIGAVRGRLQAGEDWRLCSPIRRTDADGDVYDLVHGFLDEYRYFPFAPRDDFLDACSRVYDMDITLPTKGFAQAVEPRWGGV